MTKSPVVIHSVQKYFVFSKVMNTVTFCDWYLEAEEGISSWYRSVLLRGSTATSNSWLGGRKKWVAFQSNHIRLSFKHVYQKLLHRKDFGLATKKANADLILAVDSEISPYSLLYTYWIPNLLLWCSFAKGWLMFIQDHIHENFYDTNSEWWNKGSCRSSRHPKWVHTVLILKF